MSDMSFWMGRSLPSFSTCNTVLLRGGPYDGAELYVGDRMPASVQLEGSRYDVRIEWDDFIGIYVNRES